MVIANQVFMDLKTCQNHALLMNIFRMFPRSTRWTLYNIFADPSWYPDNIFEGRAR